MEKDLKVGVTSLNEVGLNEVGLNNVLIMTDNAGCGFKERGNKLI